MERTVHIAAVLTALACCFGTPACRDASARQTAQNATAQTASSAPECDKFFRTVSSCIDTKVPESERSDKRGSLAFVRSTLDRAPKGQAGQFCADALREEIQKDTYGCYAEEAAKAGVQTPCSLITRAEIKEILGSPVGDPIRDESTCVYPGEGASSRYVKLVVDWKDGRDELEAARAGAGILDKHLKRTVGQSLVDGETIEGLGDDAFFLTAGIMPWLYVRKRDTSIQIEAYGGTQEQMIAIGRKVLDRVR